MEDEGVKAKNIFVDIDALFDVRLPLLYTLLRGGTEDFFKVMKTYEERYIDEFYPISADIFTAYYKKLNKAIFKLAAPTEIFLFVQQLAIEMKEELQLLHEKEEIILYVNLYPFKFSTNEIVNLTISIKEAIGLEYVKVKLVNMDNDKLNPEWLHDNIYALIKYRGLDWLEYNTANYRLIERPLMDMLFVIPAILTGTNGYIKKIKNKERNELFLELSKMSTTLLTMNVVKTEFFCTKFK